MDRKTLKALKGSIKKWEKIVAKKGNDDGAANCPLCGLYPMSCEGCPIDKKTTNGCNFTPYEKWNDHQIEIHGERLPFTIQCKICERHAKAELKFLKSLLPKEKKNGKILLWYLWKSS